MRVERIELPKTLTVPTALQFVGRIASVCTGIEVKDDEHAERIGKKNLTEAYGDTPTRAFEFLPIDMYDEQRYLNFRDVIKKDYTLLEVVDDFNDHEESFLKDYKNFHIFHITAPRYVMAHIKTHQTLSSMMSSIRIGCNGEKEYEFPEIENDFNLENYDLGDSFFRYTINDIEIEYNFENYRSVLMNNNGKIFAKNFPSEVFYDLLNYFYKRPEITKRPLSDFELVEMKICGYSEAWEWFINQRTCKGVQKETIEVANMIKELIK